MADEDKTMMEVDDTDGESGVAKASPLKTYGLYAGIILVAVAAAYFVTLKVVKPMFAGDSAATEQVEAAADEEPADEGHGSVEEKPEGGHGSSSHGSDDAGAAGDVIMVKEIIVNPAGTGGTRFLSTSIGFELTTGQSAQLFDERGAIIRDALITILSSQSIPELSDFKQREKLRKLIKLRVEKLLKTDDIAAVYFTEFVLQ